MGRVIDVQPVEFATVRAVLKLSQGEFAERLGISRRTVIRGEQRGIELPGRYRAFHRSPEGDERATLRDKWEAAVKDAERDPQRYLEAAKSDTILKILGEMSQTQAARGTGYYGYGDHVQSWKEKLARLGDTKPGARDKVSQARRPKAAKKRKKLARRKRR